MDSVSPDGPTAATAVQAVMPGSGEGTLVELLFERDGEPSTLGRYRLVETLGTGGSGVVYRAHDPKLDRDVAIKVLHSPGVTTAEERQRLAREARSIASVVHPNVVEVFDVGVTTLARAGEHATAGLFVVMELVEGSDLSAWMSQPHSIDEILRAFVDAAHGLAAIHERGLVHRDFKPGNVLVGPRGEIKITDFGLARVLGAGETPGGASARDSTSEGSSSLTQTGTVLGTPLYMAPEQHLGRTLDARTDQYAYCVSLLRVLGGRRPFVATSMSELLVEKQRGPSLDALPRDVGRNVRGVLRRGLNPRPEGRFESMQDLVQALTATSRRPWASIGLAGALALGAAAVPWVGGADPEQPAASASVASRFDPSNDEARARGIELRERADTLREEGRNEAAAELFEQARAVSAGAGDDVNALRDAVSLVDLSLQRSDIPTARRWLREAEASLERGPSMPTKAHSLVLHSQARILERERNYDRALELRRRNLQLLEADPDTKSIDRAQALEMLGVLYAQRGEMAEAMEPLEEAIALFEAEPEVEAEHLSGLLSNVAGVAQRLGRFDQAESLLRRSLAAAAERGPLSRSAVIAHYNLGGFYLGLHRLEDARREYEAARAGHALEDPSGVGVAKCDTELARIAARAGDLDEAARRLDSAVITLEGALGPNHPGVIRALVTQADVDWRRGELGSAFEIASRVRTLLEGLPRPDPDRLRYTDALLATILVDQGESSQALGLAERALEGAVSEEQHGVHVARPRFAVARALRATDPARARTQARLALEELGSDDPQLQADIEAWLGR
jgi:tetratricopeptide (TPR) repeat protein